MLVNFISGQVSLQQIFMMSRESNFDVVQVLGVQDKACQNLAFAHVL